MLSVSEGEIDKKAEEQKKELEKKNTELTDKLSECENKIEGSQKKIDELSEELDNFKSKEFIQSKIKNLPVVESKKILEKTKGMSFVELKKNYKSIFESVQEEVKKEQEVKEDDNGLEEAINDILEGKKSETSSKETSDKDVEGTESTPATDEENNEVITDECENTDSVVVTESQMQSWIETLNRITPKK